MACSWCYNSDKSPRREAQLSCSFYRSHFHFSKLPRPHRTVHLVYSMCVSFFYSYILTLLALSFFQFCQYFLVFFSYLFFHFLPGLLASHCMCRVVAWRQCGASRPCRNTDCLPLALSISLSLFTHPLCVDCINLAHVVIAAIDA